MKESRHYFLADAGRTGDEHAAVGWRDALDLLAQLADRMRGADEIILAASALLQGFVFVAQASRFDRPLDDEHQAIGLEGLLDEVIGTDLDRRDGRFDIAVATDHDHRKLRQLALHDLQYFKSVKLAALQPDIEHDERGLARANGRERFGAIARLSRFISFVAEYPAHQAADIGLIVNDNNVV